MRSINLALATLGVIAAAAMAAASLAWGLGYDPLGFSFLRPVGETGRFLVTFQFAWRDFFLLDPANWIAFGLVIVVLAAALRWALSRAGRGAIALAIAWISAVPIAFAYGISLPKPISFEGAGEFPHGVHADLRWPMLALGMQAAALCVFLIWRAARERGRSATRTAAQWSKAAVCAAAAALLIRIGMTWINVDVFDARPVEGLPGEGQAGVVSSPVAGTTQP